MNDTEDRLRAAGYIRTFRMSSDPGEDSARGDRNRSPAGF